MSERQCGECTACCTHLKIDTPEFQKLAGPDCPHLVPRRGCGIYETRPQACRDFLCLWRQMPAMPDDWRPDRSGVLLVVTKDNVPPGYATDYGIKIQLIDRSADIRNPNLVRGILSFFHARIPLFLAVQGPVGRVAKMVLLNPELEPIVAARNPEALVDHLAQVMQALEREPKEAVVLVHRKQP
jgi:hypothetical protein